MTGRAIPSSSIASRLRSAGARVRAPALLGVRLRDRVALERLCRYGLRAPFAVSRFSLAADGRIVYRLRKPWPKPGGARCLVLEPGELLKRLAALVPAPYSHMVRYHGVFANRSRWRPLLPSPPAVVDREDEPEKGTLPLVSGSAEEKADVAGDAAGSALARG